MRKETPEEGERLPFDATTSSFRFYAVGQAVSVAGDRIALIALVFLVLRFSHAFAPALALFYVCRVLPTLLGGVVAGALVDQLDRRRVMFACDLSRALLIASLPVLAHFSLWIIYPIVVLLFAGTLFFSTAARAAIPDIVPEEGLVRANSLLNTIETSADIFYAVGGFLVVALPFGIPFYLDAVSFLFSAIMIWCMRVPVHHLSATPVEPMLRRIQQGIRFLWGDPFLRWSTITFVGAPFAGGIAYVLMPLYTARSLSTSSGLFGPLQHAAFRFSLIEVCIGMGAVIGSQMMGPLARRFPRGTIFGLGITGTGLTDACYALTGNLYVAAGITILSGIFNSLFVISGLTLIQSLTPTALRGRVFAARLTVINGALALGSAAGGLLLLHFSYAALWIAFGGIVILFSLAVWCQPAVRGAT